MKSAVCLLVALWLAKTNAVGSGYGGLPIDEVETLTLNLEEHLLYLLDDLTELKTKCSAMDDQVTYIDDFILPHLHLNNEKQDAVIEDFQKQMKDCEHTLDELKALESEAASRTEITEERTQNQLLSIVGGHPAEPPQIQGFNEEQDEAITELTNDLKKEKKRYLKRLTNVANKLDNRRSVVSNRVRNFYEFILFRTCQYASGGYLAGFTTHITFEIPFDYTPTVTAWISGIHGHLDVPNYDEDNTVHPNLVVSGVSTSGFSLSASDLSEGSVELKYIYATWMACQKIDVDLAPPHLEAAISVNETGPTATETGPGAIETGPGAIETGPGGENETAPGATETGPGAIETGPGAIETGPEIIETGRERLEAGPEGIVPGPSGGNETAPGAIETRPERIETGRERLEAGPEGIVPGPSGGNETAPGAIETGSDPTNT